MGTALATIGSAELFLALSMFALHRRHGGAHLLLWAWGWLVGALGNLPTYVAFRGVTGGASSLQASAGAVAISALVAHGALQYAGGRTLRTGKTPSTGVAWVIGGVATVAFGIGLAGAALAPNLRARLTIVLGVPCAIFGFAFLSSAWAVRAATRSDGPGVVALPVAFAAYGGQRLLTALAAIGVVGIPLIPTMAFVDLFALGVVGFAIAVWFLERQHDALTEAERRRQTLAVQLRQSQKLEALGELAAGIAHDFNNLLTVVGGHADLIVADPSDRAAVLASAEQIVDAKDRGSRLITSLMTFARKQESTPRVVLALDVVGGLRPLMQRLLGEHVHLEVRAGSGPQPVYVDPSQLEQVLINLVINARDAMPDGGRIWLEVDRMANAEPMVIGDVPVPVGSWCVFRVIDEGEGMTDDVRRRVFEPFFTTKVRERGTGLGLAVAYGVVEASKGHIVAQSTPGRGSTFTVLLPVAGGRPEGR